MCRRLLLCGVLGAELLGLSAGMSAAQELQPTAENILKGFVPRQRDVDFETPKPAEFAKCTVKAERFGKGSKGTGWYRFEQKGVHFIGLVNVATIKEGGLGVLGQEQLDWLKADLAGLAKSTPIVVFAHIPLWTIYPQWGWGTDDSALALALLQPFGSVTVLNGHIHQAMQKIEGHITFHTARSTAFPQPEPGKAPKAGPMLVPAETLRTYLGLTSVTYTETSHSLAIVDATLAGKS